MKFVSKMSNYRVILQHSVPAEPITGRLATPGLWVKFENGVADVRDEKIIEMMKRHPVFGSDFIIMEEEQKDPFEDMRNSVEPDHNITEIKYGHVDGTTNPRPALNVNKETKRMLMDMAKDMATEMAPALAKQMLKEVLSQNSDLVKGALQEASGVSTDDQNETEDISLADSENNSETEIKAKRGRPKRIN